MKQVTFRRVALALVLGTVALVSAGCHCWDHAIAFGHHHHGHHGGHHGHCR